MAKKPEQRFSEVCRGFACDATDKALEAARDAVPGRNQSQWEASRAAFFGALEGVDGVKELGAALEAECAYRGSDWTNKVEEDGTPVPLAQLAIDHAHAKAEAVEGKKKAGKKGR